MPQRLIGVPDAEIIKDSEEIDQEGSGGRVTFLNPEDHMDFEREQLEIEIGEDVPENEEGNQDRDNHEGENVGDGNQEENDENEENNAGNDEEEEGEQVENAHDVEEDGEQPGNS